MTDYTEENKNQEEDSKEYNNDSNQNNNLIENQLTDEEILIKKLKVILHKMSKYPYLRQEMWKIILTNERRFYENHLPSIPSDYLHHHYFLYSYAYISTSLDNEIHRYSDTSEDNKFSLLSQNNARNILLLYDLNSYFGNVLMSVQHYGNDFAMIDKKDDRYLIVLNKNNIKDEKYVDYEDMESISRILLDMEDRLSCQYVFKLKYHNIEAKSNLFSIEEFTFFNMMVSSSFFKDTETNYMPAWHELLYMENKPLLYDGFIKTWFDDSSNNNITLIFKSIEGGKRLSAIVVILRKIFTNTNIFLNDVGMYPLSAFYMKVETWMLYKDIKWNLKEFDGWAYIVDNLTMNVFDEASLEKWSEIYANVSHNEFYAFIKKRLVYIFEIYTEIRNLVKKQLLKYLNEICKNEQIIDQKQQFIENILNEHNILYKFKKAKSIRFTGGISSPKMFSSNEIDEYLNAIIGSDEDFIKNLKDLGTLITNGDPNVLITDQEYDDIVKNKSTLNETFTRFYKSWSLKKKG